MNGVIGWKKKRFCCRCFTVNFATFLKLIYRTYPDNWFYIFLICIFVIAKNFIIYFFAMSSLSLSVSQSRSGRPEVFCEKSVLRNIAKLTGKHLCPRLATLFKKKLWHRCFPVNFVKFLRTLFS